jgi:hypothetical protein
MRTNRDDEISTMESATTRDRGIQQEDDASWDHVVAGKGERRYLEVASMNQAGI